MELAALLPSHASTIIDAGAHTGRTAEALDFLYRPRRLWAIEPNPAHTLKLESRFKGRPQFTVVASCLGEEPGEASFKAYEFDSASSLFSCRPGHLASLGFSERHSSLPVRVITLRDPIFDFAETLDLLKLDCQGAELAALKGAGARIREIRWIYCEVSFEAIYDGAPLFGEVHSFLRAAGFELRHLSNFSGTGHSVQWADALYANGAGAPTG